MNKLSKVWKGQTITKDGENDYVVNNPLPERYSNCNKMYFNYLFDLIALGTIFKILITPNVQDLDLHHCSKRNCLLLYVFYRYKFLLYQFFEILFSLARSIFGNFSFALRNTHTCTFVHAKTAWSFDGKFQSKGKKKFGEVNSIDVHIIICWKNTFWA
jgi:hypothetical protein